MGSSVKRNEEKSDEWCAQQLRRFEEERQQILKDATLKTSRLFPNIDKQMQYRVKLAKSYRDLMLTNVYNHYKSEIEQAWNEFEKGKRRLQSTMLDLSVERRHKVDTIRHYSAAKTIMNHHKTSNHNHNHNLTSTTISTTSSILKKRKRSYQYQQQKLINFNHINQVIRNNSRPPAKLNPFIEHLEKQGLVRVSLTPDEVNADLEGIFQSMDSSSNHHINHKLLKSKSIGTVGFGGGGYGILRTNNSHNNNMHSNHKNNKFTIDNQHSVTNNHHQKHLITNGTNNPHTKHVRSNHQSRNNPITDGIGGNKFDKVHISKGILHYHESIFEKGDRVAVFYTRPKPTLRYEGTLASVNSKEIIIRSGPGASTTPHRVLVSNLCSGRYLLKSV